VPAHRVHRTTQKIAETGWEVFTHPPYSPDLASSDFHLYRPLKESFSGIKFENNHAVKQHVLRFVYSSDKDFYAAGFTQLVECWELCTELNGQCAEK